MGALEIELDGDPEERRESDSNAGRMVGPGTGGRPEDRRSDETFVDEVISIW